MVLFLRENDAAPFREAILDSCLHHRAFDRQTESYRTEYLFDIMQATGEPEFYAAHIRQALAEDNEGYSYGQLYELSARLAGNGDADARCAMYARFAREAPRLDTTGTGDLVALDGLTGYLFVAEQFQQHPLPEEDYWEEAGLLKQLEEKMGRETARQALEDAAQDRPLLTAYLAGVERKRAQWDEQRGSRRPSAAPTYDELAARVADPTQTARWPRWRRWGKQVDDETFIHLAHDLLAETDRGPLLKLLHLFRERPFPLDIDRLLALAWARDEDIAEASRWALGNLSDPRVRALALELWEDETAPLDALHLLRNNFAEGDYTRVERLVGGEMSANDYHSLEIITRHFLEANLVPEAVPTLLALYEHGRCALCRCHVVELLLALGPLPAWLQEECRYDADTKTRSLITKSSAP